MLDHPEEEQAAADQTVGSKVNAIIEAAEAAAKEIGQDARREALEIKQQAEKQAAALIEELTRDAVQTKVEADQYARDLREYLCCGLRRQGEYPAFAKRVVAAGANDQV